MGYQPIGRERFPKLDVAGSNPVGRSKKSRGYGETRNLSFAKMVMGLRPTLHHENRLSSPRADARPRR